MWPCVGRIMRNLDLLIAVTGIDLSACQNAAQMAEDLIVMLADMASYLRNGRDLLI